MYYRPARAAGDRVALWGAGERARQCGGRVYAAIRVRLLPQLYAYTVDATAYRNVSEPVWYRDYAYCTCVYRACACERELPVEQSQYSEYVYICARANHHSYLQRACKCRVQSSGKTKTVLIAAVLAINEVNMSQPAIINQPSSTGRKERKLR